MRVKKIVLLVCGFMAFQGFFIFPEAYSRSQSDVEKLIGVWSFVSYEEDGVENPWGEQDVEVAPVITFDKDRFVVRQGDNVRMIGSFQLKPSLSQSQLFVEIRVGVYEGTKMHGIYELQENRMKFCMGPLDKPRPSEFSVYEGSQYIMGVLNRSGAEQ